MDVTITVDSASVRRFQGDLERLVLQVEAIAKETLQDFAIEIMEESQKQVPRDTSSLHSSAYIEAVGGIATIPEITFGYGGPNDTVNPKTGELTSSYALAVHERLDVKHPIGKAKYLEDPVNEFAPKFPSKLDKALAPILGGGSVV